MEYRKINLWDDATNQPSKFTTRCWVKINESRGTYNVRDQIKCKTFDDKVKFMWL